MDLPQKIILRLEEVSKSYIISRKIPPIEVLKGVNLEVKSGESVAIIGPSGSGKSTLLNIIGALDKPDTGRVIFDGQDLSSLTNIELAKFRNEKIGFVFQFHHLLPQCTALENVLMPALALNNNKPGEETIERAKKLLSRVGLGERFNHRPFELSGGERQRVAVVRALINRPELLLADEPTGALDRVSANALADLLVELNREENVALIVVTHWLELARRMNRVLVLRDGKLYNDDFSNVR